MNRWESIAEQFDGIDGVTLKAILRNDVVVNWDVTASGKLAGKKFIDIADEASAQLGSDDRFAWFNFLWKTFQGKFKGNVFDGTEQPSGERITLGNLSADNVGALSARAARDLAEIEPKQGEDEKGDTSEGPVSPQHFLWNGERTKIAPTPWHLINCMWKNDLLPESEVGAAVWGGETDVTESNFSSTISRANRALESIGYSKSLSKENGVIFWD